MIAHMKNNPSYVCLCVSMHDIFLFSHFILAQVHKIYKVEFNRREKPNIFSTFMRGMRHALCRG